MDARSNLARFLVFYVHMSQDDAEHMVQQALNEELHEAAEKIREHIGKDDYPNEPERVRALVSFGRSMADLIDPEKEDAS